MGTAGTKYYYYVLAITKDGTESEKSNIVSRTCDLAQPQITVSNVEASGKIKIAWNAIEGAESYEVWRATTEDGSYQRISSPSKTSLTNISITAGTTYYYKVKAISSNTDANSAFSEIQSGTCTLAQPQITVTTMESSGKIKITWDEIDDAEGYEVWRATSEEGPYQRISSPSKTSLTNTSTTAGTTYYYKVKAISSNADANSAFSEPQSSTCILAQPTVTLSNVASSGKIKIAWDEIDGAESYEVWRATTKNGTYKRISTTKKLSLTNTSTTAGNTYYYKVRALAADSTANSAYSSIKSRVCDLAQVTIQLSNRASDGAITIQWEAVEGASGYQVYRATSKSGSYTCLGTTSKTTYNNTSGTAGKTYYYKVRAICDNENATGAFSEVKSRMRDLPQPEVSIALSSGKPKLSWDTVDGAVSYQVYRATSKTGSYTMILETTNCSYKNTSAAAGKTYYYKVIAVCQNKNGNSDHSEIVSITATK